MIDYRNITLALAGVFQASELVIQLAKKGQIDERTLIPLIESLLKLDAESCEDVYGGIQKIKPGLRLIDSQLRSGASGRSTNLGRYVASLLNLERHLDKSEEMQAVIATRITQIKRLTSEHHLMDDVIINNLADLYKDTISTLPLRIQVVGEENILKQPHIQNLVRCTLLCGLRSAVLWRQMGGKRRQLLFSRKSIITSAENLLLGR